MMNNDGEKQMRKILNFNAQARRGLNEKKKRKSAYMRVYSFTVFFSLSLSNSDVRTSLVVVFVLLL